MTSHCSEEKANTANVWVRVPAKVTATLDSSEFASIHL